jgi:hypothetical protein
MKTMPAVMATDDSAARNNPDSITRSFHQRIRLATELRPRVEAEPPGSPEAVNEGMGTSSGTRAALYDLGVR